MKNLLDNPDFVRAYERASETFNQVMDEYEKESETYWNSLSYENQLKVFCAVVRRIHEGDLVKHRSYRGVLYDIFNFGPDAYAVAQMSGYMDIHNALYDCVQRADDGK